MTYELHTLEDAKLASKRLSEADNRYIGETIFPVAVTILGAKSPVVAASVVSLFRAGDTYQSNPDLGTAVKKGLIGDFIERSRDPQLSQKFNEHPGEVIGGYLSDIPLVPALGVKFMPKTKVILGGTTDAYGTLKVANKSANLFAVEETLQNSTIAGRAATEINISNLAPELGNVIERTGNTELKLLNPGPSAEMKLLNPGPSAKMKLLAQESSKAETVRHAVGSTRQAESVLKGIDPKFFNPNSRFGGGFYVTVKGETAVAELAAHDVKATQVIRYDFNLSKQRVLDLTNPNIASQWGFTTSSSTEACQAIAANARAQGYNAIAFPSYRGSGTNYVIYDKFDEILKPQMISPVD